MALEFKLPYSAEEISNRLGNVPVNTENINRINQELQNEIAKETAARNTAISEHDASTVAHDDIRNLISELQNKVMALLDSDDTTLDQMSEIVAYIKDNRDIIDSITTDKVNVADIIDNLTTNSSNKPLSAAQGVVLKNLVDELMIEASNKTIVSVAQSLTSGTQIGTVTINGAETKLYAPTKPIISVSDSQLVITT